MKLEIESETGRHLVEIEEQQGRLRARVDERLYEVRAFRPEPGVYTLFIGPRVIEVHVEGNANGDAVSARVRERTWRVRLRDRHHRRGIRDSGPAGRVPLLARMPGKVVRLLVQTGDVVQVGQGILVLEAMKMQNEVKAPKSGRLLELRVREGQTVGAGELLAVIE